MLAARERGTLWRTPLDRSYFQCWNREGEAANDPPARQTPEEDEEAMPIEEGFSIVP